MQAGGLTGYPAGQMEPAPQSPATAARPARAWLWELAAAGLSLLGVGLRLVQARFVFAGDQVALPGVDPYYHLWRARMLLTTWPDPPHFDPAISFPDGGPIHWPPGFDSLLTLPGLAGRIDLLPAWGALLPTLLGGLAVYLTWRLGRAALGRPAGLVAAGLMAAMPGAIHPTIVGRADHHAIVAPISLGLFLAALASLRASDRLDRLAWALVVAVLAAAAIGSWPVTPPLFFLPVPLLILWTALGDGPDKVRPLAVTGMLATVGLTGVCIIGSGDLTRAPVSVYEPSAVHFALYGLAAAGCALAAWRPRWTLWAAGGLLGLGGLSLLVVPGLSHTVGQALATAGGHDPTYAMVSESRSLLMPAGRFTLHRPIELYTYLVLLSPLLLGLLIWRAAREEPGDAGLRLVAIYAGLGVGLLVIQERFGEFAAPAVALLLAWGLSSLGRMVRIALRGTRHKWRARALGLGLAISLCPALAPLVEGQLVLGRTDPVQYARELAGFGHALATHLGSRPGQAEPDAVGLLTGWREAHPLLWYTGRPVITSSFGTAEALAGNRAAFGMLLSADEGAVVAGMHDRRLGYLIASDTTRQAQNMARLAGLRQRYTETRYTVVDGVQVRNLKPLEPYYASVIARLWLGDGSRLWPNGIQRPGLGHFRLILESPAHTPVAGVQVSLLKAFERVAGAELTGVAAAGQPVRLRLAVVTNTGREFTYSRRVQAGSDGRFHVRVPYPAPATGPGCHAVGPYRLKIGDRVIHQPVSEGAVRRGLVVEIGTDPPGP